MSRVIPVPLLSLFTGFELETMVTACALCVCVCTRVCILLHAVQYVVVKNTKTHVFLALLSKSTLSMWTLSCTHTHKHHDFLLFWTDEKG